MKKVDPQFSEWYFKERIKHSLAARFFLRFHASLLLLAAVGTGWLTSKVLFSLGMEGMLIRHVLSILSAYAGFLLALQIWIRFSGIREYLDSQRSKELLGGPIPVKGKDGIQASDAAQLPLDIASSLVPEGCAIVIIAVLGGLAVFYVAGGYIVVHAAELFTEVVFELLLAAGLIKGLRRVDLLETGGRVPLSTLWALAMTLIVVTLFDTWAMHAYPEVKTVGDVVKAVRGQ